jgi:2,4-dienoyl-CoA reductase-like NADH-dependent reductase (Old Yellow Enzyme family)
MTQPPGPTAVVGGRLLEPVRLAGRTAGSRVLFGAHETNLGRGRSFSDRHVAYYARRAVGGAGIVVTETASVHPGDWPYERAPLASNCEAGWARVVQACRPHGALVLAGLGHTGAQGSSAYSQSALWAPSRVPDTVSRELPMEMEPAEIEAVTAGFAAAAALATAAGADGVEVDAGPSGLLRQFHSGLTNQRTDEYGTDRLRLTRQVLARTRAAIGDDAVLALRLACDELAPWAGVTPEQAGEQAVALADLVDLLVVTRGGPYSASAYRPDGHTAPMFNLELARSVRTALRVAGTRTLVALQGSVVDPVAADGALAGDGCDLVEMTRALIADADLVAKLRAGHPERVRPCVLCNQTCRVRDSRNPIITCIADPRSGHETTDPDLEPAVAGPDPQPAVAGSDPERAGPGPAIGTRAGRPEVLVVGAGPAGLEAARVLAARGRRVRVCEASDATGGAARLAARLPGRERFALLLDWWLAECTRLGVTVERGSRQTAASLDARRKDGVEVLLTTGGGPGPQHYLVGPGAQVRTDAELLGGWSDDGPADLPDGPVVVLDLVGGPVGLGMAELLAGVGREVSVVTADQIVGTMLAMSGDLADGNTRLLRAGVVRRTSMLLREVRPGTAVLSDRFSGAPQEIDCAVLVHCGNRLPEEELYLARPGTPRAGDAVAPRSVLEAVLEGRRAAVALAPVAVPAGGHDPAGTGVVEAGVAGTGRLAGAR